MFCGGLLFAFDGGFRWCALCLIDLVLASLGWVFGVAGLLRFLGFVGWVWLFAWLRVLI